MINNKPSVEDIRQMYAYHQYFDAKKVALVYSGNNTETKGHFVDITNQNQNTNIECSLKFIEVKDNIKDWKDYICENIGNWIKT